MYMDIYIFAHHNTHGTQSVLCADFLLWYVRDLVCVTGVAAAGLLVGRQLSAHSLLGLGKVKADALYKHIALSHL